MHYDDGQWIRGSYEAAYGVYRSWFLGLARPTPKAVPQLESMLQAMRDRNKNRFGDKGGM